MIRLRHLAEINPATPEFEHLPADAEVPFVPLEAVWPDGVDSSRRKLKGEASTGYTRFREGDIVVPKITPTFQANRTTIAVGLEGGVAAGTTELHVVRPGPNIDRRYVRYLLSSRPFLHGGEAEMIGVAGQKRVPDGWLRDLGVPITGLPEQRAIADFLDTETARLDALIAKKRRLIALLDERRVATLTSYISGTEAAARCASASDWFPSLPGGWRVSTIGGVTRAIMDGPHVSPTYLEPGEGGVPFISVRNISVQGWDLDSAKFISRSDYEVFSRRIKPERGDVLLTKGGSTGIAREVDLDFDFHVWVHVAILKVQRSVILPAFLVAVLNSRPGYEQSQLGTRGATNQDLALGRISKIQIPLPPLAEQRRIMGSIAASARPVADADASLEAQIDLLVEHRQALITAAVTGELAVPRVVV